MCGTIIVDCRVGNSAARRVLLGFAPASLLHRLSFADVLNEDTGQGYQRRFNAKHSQDFRRYIREPTAATLPLTLNLRPDCDGGWRLAEQGRGRAQLIIEEGAGKIMAQVDCQHRLGYLGDLDIPLPFMCFLGLDVAEEMEVFNIINSKAKGLSTSLLDFHDAQLSQDLAKERPEIFIALYLNSEASSPWRRQLDLGGSTTSWSAKARLLADDAKGDQAIPRGDPHPRPTPNRTPRLRWSWAFGRPFPRYSPSNGPYPASTS